MMLVQPICNMSVKLDIPARVNIGNIGKHYLEKDGNKAKYLYQYPKNDIYMDCQQWFGYFAVLPGASSNHSFGRTFGSFYVVNQKGNKLSSRDTAIQKPHHYQYILD